MQGFVWSISVVHKNEGVLNVKLRGMVVSAMHYGMFSPVDVG